MATTSAPSMVSVPEQNQTGFVSLVYVDTSTQSLPIVTWERADFRGKLVSWFVEKERDIFELKSVTKWQKKCLDYQSVYNAYLLGSLTEEEFETDSDEYTSDIREISTEEILATINRLNKLLDFKLTASDFASYLQTDTSVVSDAIESINEKIPYFPRILRGVEK
jgi:hypothetical protein